MPQDYYLPDFSRQTFRFVVDPGRSSQEPLQFAYRPFPMIRVLGPFPFDIGPNYFDIIFSSLKNKLPMRAKASRRFLHTLLQPCPLTSDLER